MQNWAWQGNITDSPQNIQSSPVLAGYHCWTYSLDSSCSFGQEEMGKETSSKWENISITQFCFFSLLNILTKASNLSSEIAKVFVILF